MAEMIEISVLLPKELKIYIPRQLLEEFLERVQDEKLSATMTEALTEELKKVRFRIELKKSKESIKED